MANELTLLTQEKFGGIELDFYRNNENEIFMTIAQLAEALEYASKSAIENMLNRNPELKEEEFSSTRILQGRQKTRLFNVNGIRAIIQLSDAPLFKKMSLLEYFGERVYYPIERVEHKYLRVIMDTFRDKETKRELVLGDYRVDLIFPNEKVLVECDEYGHKHYCQVKEKERELFFESQGYTIIRFNPNEKNFRIGLVIAEILDVFKNKGAL